MNAKFRAHKKLTHHQRLQWTQNPVIFSVMLEVVHSQHIVNSTRPHGHHYSHRHHTKKSLTANLPEIHKVEKSPSVDLPVPNLGRVENYSFKGTSALNVPHIRKYKVS